MNLNSRQERRDVRKMSSCWKWSWKVGGFMREAHLCPSPSRSFADAKCAQSLKGCIHWAGKETWNAGFLQELRWSNVCALPAWVLCSDGAQKHSVSQNMRVGWTEAAKTSVFLLTWEDAGNGAALFHSCMSSPSVGAPVQNKFPILVEIRGGQLAFPQPELELAADAPATLSALHLGGEHGGPHLWPRAGEDEAPTCAFWAGSSGFFLVNKQLFIPQPSNPYFAQKINKKINKFYS